MTENEAKEILNRIATRNIFCTLEERELSAFEIAEKALEEIQQYRTIGTVEECRVAVQRMKPVKVKCFKKHNEMLYYCDNCKKDVFSNNDKYCAVCGQTLDWSEKGE